MALDDDQRRWFVDTGRRIVADGRSLADLTRDDVDPSAVTGLIDQCRDDLADGLGLVLVRGVPVDELTTPEISVLSMI